MSIPPLTHRGYHRDSVVTQVKVGRHVERGREQEVFGKSELQRPLLRRPGKVDIPARAFGWSSGRLCGCLQHMPIQTKVPFSNHACSVSPVLKKAGNCFSCRVHNRNIWREEDAFLQSRPPVISTRQDPISGWCAHGRSRVSIREAHSICSKLVEIGSRNLPSSVGHVAVAHIISENEDKIRARLNFGRSQENGYRGKKNWDFHRFQGCAKAI